MKQSQVKGSRCWRNRVSKEWIKSNIRCEMFEQSNHLKHQKMTHNSQVSVSISRHNEIHIVWTRVTQCDIHEILYLTLWCYLHTCAVRVTLCWRCCHHHYPKIYMYHSATIPCASSNNHIPLELPPDYHPERLSSWIKHRVSLAWCERMRTIHNNVGQIIIMVITSNRRW